MAAASMCRTPYHDCNPPCRGRIADEPHVAGGGSAVACAAARSRHYRGEQSIAGVKTGAVDRAQGAVSMAMKDDRPDRWTMSTLCFAAACRFQITGLIRYIHLLPDDRVRVLLYTLSVPGLGLAAF